MAGKDGWLHRLDARAGDGLEAALRQHHRWRLRRLGWADVLDPPAGEEWWAGASPVRTGNAMEVFIDGEAALAEIEAAIRAARRSVHVAGWHASPDFRLTRAPGAEPLRDLLDDMARQVPVRILLWAGPPLPVFQPTRRLVKAARAEFVRAGRVRCALDRRERSMHCHHEKLVILDEQIAFVGGIDLTALQGDRHDESTHPPRHALGWHDAAVRLRGPAVGDVARHFGQRWSEVTGERLPVAVDPSPAGSTSVQVLRTVPERTYAFAAKGEFGILAAYLRALRAAERFIYLENQFLWSPEIVDVLAEKLRRPPNDGFRLVILLPTKPNNGADTTRGQIGRLLEADDGSGRLLATTIGAHGERGTGSVYVHAKVGIVDDRWLTVGSANLNEHSLFNDTEMNVLTCDPQLARDTRLRLWAEHTERAVEEIDGDPTAVIDELWRPIAAEQGRRIEAGLPRTARLSLLPNVSRRTDRLGGPLRGLSVDG